MLLDNILAILRDFIPINHAPKGINVLGTTILVFQVVCMLPYIEAENLNKYKYKG
jgi:hypothetical protein